MGVFVKIFLLGLVLVAIEPAFQRYDVKHITAQSWTPKETIIGKR